MINERVPARRSRIPCAQDLSTPPGHDVLDLSAVTCWDRFCRASLMAWLPRKPNGKRQRRVWRCVEATSAAFLNEAVGPISLSFAPKRKASQQANSQSPVVPHDEAQNPPM